MPENRSNPDFENYLSSVEFYDEKNAASRQISKVGWFTYNYGRVLEHLGASAEILEIGPGYGEILMELRKRGFANSRGVDVSKEVCVHCNALVPDICDLTDDTILYLASNRGRFDAVMAFHVVEHVPQELLGTFIAAVRGSLRRRGTFVLETPNMANPLTGMFHRHNDLTHTKGFTASSLVQMCRIAGFGNVQIVAPRVPMTSVPRMAQRALQSAIEGMLKLALKAYMPNIKVIMTQHVGAIAECAERR